VPKDGFIYLYKKALELKYSSPLFGFFTRCLLLANHSKGKEPGVVNISTRDLSDITHLSRPTIISYLKQLQSDETIKILSTSTRRTKFYFINYLQYQTQRQTGKNEAPVGETGKKEIPIIDQTGKNEAPVYTGEENQKNAQNSEKNKNWSKRDTKLVKTTTQTGQNDYPNWSKRDTSAKAKSKLGSKSKLSKRSKRRGNFTIFEENLFKILLRCPAIKNSDAWKLPELINDYPEINYELEFKKFVEWWPGPKKKKKPWAVLRNWLGRVNVKEKPSLVDSGMYREL